MKKAAFVVLLLLSLSITVLAQDDELSWECPDGYQGQTLDIFNWYDYIADDTISNFEVACDVTVNYTEFDEESFVYDTLILGNPGYDLVIATGAIIAPLLSQELLVPLNYELIPNADNVFAQFLHPIYDAQNEYVLPYAWGSMGVLYRREAFPDGISSWQDVWAFEGKSAWINDSRAMLGVALLNLGYEANSTNTGEVLEARDFLGEKGSSIAGIGSEEDIVALFMAGEIDMAIAYSGTMANLLGTCNCADYNYNIPEEGSNIFVDSMFVPVDADSADLAMLFIDYTLNPEVNASLSNLGFGSINRAATDAGLMDESFAEIDGFNPSSEVFARMFYVEQLTEDVAAAYDVAWNELLGFYGLPEE